jgi:hypothetical protein
MPVDNCGQPLDACGQARTSRDRLLRDRAKPLGLSIIAGLDGHRSPGGVDGARMPRPSMWRKNSVQHASDSLLTTASCSRCLRPCESMHQATSRASLAPWRRKLSNTASGEQVLHRDLG